MCGSSSRICLRKVRANQKPRSTGFELTGIDGGAFQVTEEGEGTAVLLVHGGSNGPADWDRVAGHVAKRHRVLRYTRYTYRSDPPAGGAAAMAGEVHDVLAVAGAVAAPLVAVGHSSGAVVLLEAALIDPSRFAGLLLYEPPVAVDEPLGGEALRRARQAADDGDPDRAMSLFLREIVEVPGYLVGALKLVEPLWRRLRAYAPAQIADTEAIESLGVGVERYRRLHVPTLLLGGGLLSPSHARIRLDALAVALPLVESRVNMRIHGHGAHYAAPRKVARIVQGFVERVATERSQAPERAKPTRHEPGA